MTIHSGTAVKAKGDVQFSYRDTRPSDADLSSDRDVVGLELCEVLDGAIVDVHKLSIKCKALPNETYMLAS